MNKTVLKNSEFAKQDINQILLRIPGAIRDQQRMGGHRPRGVSIYESQIQSIFNENDIKPNLASGTDRI